MIITTKYYCDECGKEIDFSLTTAKERYTGYNVKVKTYKRRESDVFDYVFKEDCFEGFLCDDCLDNLITSLKEKSNKHTEEMVR